jgi:hypothetical protein
VNARGDIVGVLTFVSLSPGAEGSIVQGFNFIIPADAVKEFLKGTKVDLADQSPFNEKWFSGLQKFFADDWKGALQDIQAAIACSRSSPTCGRSWPRPRTRSRTHRRDPSRGGRWEAPSRS